MEDAHPAISAAALQCIARLAPQMMTPADCGMGAEVSVKLPLGSEGTQKKTTHVLLEVVSICWKWIHYHESMIVCINLFDSSDIVHQRNCSESWWLA